MNETHAEPTNLGRESLRTMRTEIDRRFERVEAATADLKRDVRSLKFNTIVDSSTANLTVASFVDVKRRVPALEQKASS